MLREKQLDQILTGSTDLNSRNEQLQFVVANIKGEEFAFNVFSLKEVISFRAPTPVPNAPDYIEGLINVRGTIITVLSLEKMFHIEKKGPTKEESGPKHIIITSIFDNRVGLIVDEVTEILQLSKENLQEPHESSSYGIHSKYLGNVIITGGPDEKDLKDKSVTKDTKNRIILEINLKKIFEDASVKGSIDLLKSHTSLPKEEIEKDEPEKS